MDGADTPQEVARKFLVETLAKMDLSVTVSVRETVDETVFDLAGPDASQVIGKKGATLDALQLLCNRVASQRQTGARAFILLDAEGYRARREQTLATMAEQLGNQCLSQGKVITMEPLPPRERRVVHLALARFPGLTTRSEGEGEERRVQILPMPRPR